MKNIKLTIEYDGTNYFGWQIQNNLITVQGVLKESIELILQEKITLTGASRTDAKVHAIEQVANFFTKTDYSPDNIKFRLNKLLPLDIRIKKAELVGANFHSRKSVIKKTYKYKIYNADIGSPFYRNYSWHIREKIDIDLLNTASKDLIGTKNFLSFAGQKAEVKTYTRTIYEAFWEKKNNFIVFTITGSGFLKNMIRKIVGSLLAINYGKENKDFISYLIKAKDRKEAKYSAPPQGLFLYKIYY